MCHRCWLGTWNMCTNSLEPGSPTVKRHIALGPQGDFSFGTREHRQDFDPLLALNPLPVTPHSTTGCTAMIAT